MSSTGVNVSHSAQRAPAQSRAQAWWRQLAAARRTLFWRFIFQVLRWGALAFGVFYGFSHQTAISSRDKIAAAKHEYERKEKLINEAKAAWAQKNAPKSQGSGGKWRVLFPYQYGGEALGIALWAKKKENTGQTAIGWSHGLSRHELTTMQL
jgi:hypothetical protein